MTAECVMCSLPEELIGLLIRPHDTGMVNYPVDRRASIKDVLEVLVLKVKKYFNNFSQFWLCKCICWRGSHHVRLMELFARPGIVMKEKQQ